MLFQRHRMLLITSDQCLYQIISQAIHEEAFQLDHARRGAEALPLIEQDAHDLIVLDLTSDDLAGLVLLRELRRRVQAAVMTLTGPQSALDPALPLDAGADDHMAMPFNVGEFLARLRVLLRQRRQGQPGSPSMLQLDELTIDLQSYQVWRAGHAIQLSRLERALLELFVRHVNKVLSQQFILQQIWGDTYAADIDILRVAINRLRKKIEDDPAHPRYLRTKIGVGYCFSPDAEPAPLSEAASRPEPRRPPPPGATTIPARATTLIGRAAELEQARLLLTDQRVRLLTLTGIGGTGKTRLAQELAYQMLELFADGVYFVGLAAISEPELVAPAIAQTLAIQVLPDRPLIELIKEQLWGQHLLLVLDNFEQVLAAAPLLSELLQLPALKIMVTSRFPLRLPGEHEFRVPPLTLPDDQQAASAVVASAVPAVALFCERARAINPAWQITPENAAAVTQICVRLDGLPLAIELAAARTRIFSPSQLLARLSDRLAFLTGGSIHVPARQQTLRNTLQWSYDLLDRAEQLLFARLGVFVGGAELEAIEVVALGGELADAGLFDLLAALHDKNMLQISSVGDRQEPRFNFLETIRAYAQELLGSSGEATWLSERHARHYLSLAERAEPALRGPQQSAWLAALEREHDNLRAALQWSLEQADGELALRLVAALWPFWRYHNHQREGMRWAGAALARAGDAPSLARAGALYGAGRIAFDLGDYATAMARFREELALVEALDARAMIGEALRGVGEVTERQGDLVEAARFYTQSLELCGQLGDQEGIAWSLDHLGQLALKQDDPARAVALFDRSKELFEALGYRWAMAYQYGHLGEACLRSGEALQAERWFERALALLRDIGELRGQALYLYGLADAYRRQGRLREGRRCLEECLALRREVGDLAGVEVTLNRLNEMG